MAVTRISDPNGLLIRLIPRRRRAIMKNSPYYGAFLRALLVAVLTGVSTFLSTWSTTNDPKTIGIAAATAFLAPFIARFGGEGTYDTNRDTKINAGTAKMNPSDVGATWATEATRT
jgi:hypothetical protein